MRKLVVGLLGSFLAVAVLAHAKSSKVVPVELAQARYISTGYDLGDGFLSETSITLAQSQILPQDREALARVDDELKKWNRYVFTANSEDAELLIVVRTGRLAAANVGVQGGKQNGSKVGGIDYGGEVSSPDDMLTVYIADHGKEGTLLWRNLQKDGLSGSPPPLFEQFRRDVESIPTKP